MKKEDINIDQLRNFSSVFSRNTFTHLLTNSDCRIIDAKIGASEREIIKERNLYSYEDYLKYVYKTLCKKYRCEYVYKNELINEFLIKKYSLANTVAFNEFRVDNSIADVAMFNGTSRVFEIKTELDTSKRLKGQLSDYRKLFRQCYLVTHEALLEKQEKEDTRIGLILLTQKRGRIVLEEVRQPEENNELDAVVLIKSLRCNEYRHLVESYYGRLPDVGNFFMFDACLEQMKKIPVPELHDLMMIEFKSRKMPTCIKQCIRELKHICLSLNLSEKKYLLLNERLNQPINC